LVNILAGPFFMMVARCVDSPVQTTEFYRNLLHQDRAFYAPSFPYNYGADQRRSPLLSKRTKDDGTRVLMSPVSLSFNCVVPSTARGFPSLSKRARLGFPSWIKCSSAQGF